MPEARRFSMMFHNLAALLLLANISFSEVDQSSPSLILGGEDLGLHNISDKPRLQPKESKPPVGNYTIQMLGQVCLRASLGVVYIVTQGEKTLYFNMDPNATKAGGFCTNTFAVLSLQFAGGNLQFTLIKNGMMVYVRTISAFLEPEPSCKNCKSKSYIGIMNHEQLFEAASGQSFRCMSSIKLMLAESLSIKFIPLQIQAFNLTNRNFGYVVECWLDFVKRIIPIVVGAVLVGVFFIGILVFVLMREHRNQKGYEQL